MSPPILLSKASSMQSQSTEKNRALTPSSLFKLFTWFTHHSPRTVSLCVCTQVRGDTRYKVPRLQRILPTLTSIDV